MTRAWIAVAAYMGLIFLVSGLSFEAKEAQKFHADWMAHVVEYGVLGFLLARALKRTKPRLGRSGLFAAALVIGVLYAASDEYHQSFVPMRDANVYDAAADTAGLSLGAWFWTRRKKELFTNA